MKIIIRRTQHPASLDENYTELHHIVPKSEGGADDKHNLVELTAREHYVCHLLLAKIYNDYKMYCALAYMRNVHGYKVKANSRLFEAFRKRHADFMSQMSRQRKGWHWWNNGTTQAFGPTCPDGFVKGMIPGRNNKRKLSEETRRRISASHVGKSPSEETRVKISKANKGRSYPNKRKKLSKEQRDKISKALKGRKLSEEHRMKLSLNRRVYKQFKVVFSNGEERVFNTVYEAAEAAGCWKQNVYVCAKNGMPWHGIKFEVI